MQLIIPFLEMTLILITLWLIINICHALFTSEGKEIEKGFFWLSNKIKKNIKGDKK